MSATIMFLARARKEVLAAWEWYEDKQPGLGDRFLQEMEKTLVKIESNPQQFAIRVKKFREARMKTFPYLLIFQVVPAKRTIAIAAVFHIKRNPASKPVKLGKV